MTNHKSSEKRMLVEILDGDPVSTFVIDKNGIVTYWNKACERLMHVKAENVIGKRPWIGCYSTERNCLADFILNKSSDTEIRKLYNSFQHSNTIPGALEAEGYFPEFGDEGTWFYFTAAPIHDQDGNLDGAIETLVDITARKKAEFEQLKLLTNLENLVAERTKELSNSNDELKELYQKLADTQQQLIQSEKLISIGQLAAGVAHEINNPIGFVHSNINSLAKLVSPIVDLIKFSQLIYNQLDSTQQQKLNKVFDDLDIEYTIQDLPLLISESLDGLCRVKKIVQDLNDFSRTDSTHAYQWADVVQGLRSTLAIATNEIKYVADVDLQITESLTIECHPGQLNQVFLNLFVNSAQAMVALNRRGLITISGGVINDNRIFLEVLDDAGGIPDNIIPKIFDPFFTTKPVGKGTGLGLSIAYGIIKNHNGTITVKSELNKGTVFRLELPIKQPEII